MILDELVEASIFLRGISLGVGICILDSVGVVVERSHLRLSDYAPKPDTDGLIFPLRTYFHPNSR